MDREKQIDEIKKFIDKFYDTKNISIFKINIENKIADVLKTTEVTGIPIRRTIIEIEYIESLEDQE